MNYIIIRIVNYMIKLIFLSSNKMDRTLKFYELLAQSHIYLTREDINDTDPNDLKL